MFSAILAHTSYPAIYLDIQLILSSLFFNMCKDTHGDIYTRTHIHTSAHDHSLPSTCEPFCSLTPTLSLLYLRAVAHLYKPVQGPTDGLSFSIWALALTRVCTAMPTGLE